MASKIYPKDRDKLPESAVPVVSAVEAFGFKDWVYDPEYLVPAPQDSQRLQVRDEAHVGQASNVALFAEALKRGSVFPAGVSTKDGYTIDWNTRQRALHKIDRPTFGVVVIQENFVGADPSTLQRMYVLGGALNAKGPKALTRSELVNLVKHLDPVEWDAPKLAGHLGIAQTTVQSVFSGLRAEKRAEELSVPFKDHVKSSIRANVGGKSDKLAKEVFKESVSLINDACLNSSEAADLLKALIDIEDGDTARMAFLAAERSTWEPVIADFEVTGKRRRSVTHRARPCVAFFAEYKDSIDYLVDRNPTTREEYLELVEDSIEVLTALAELQRATNEEPVEAEEGTEVAAG